MENELNTIIEELADISYTALDNQVTALEIRAGRIQTWYESGRVVTEYPRDKRKKTITDHRGIK